MKQIVGFSGGADSQATALWVRQRFPPEDVILLNADAGGNESAITSEWIRWYSDTIHPVVTVHATVADMGNRSPGKIRERGLTPETPMSFALMATIKGRFPASRLQFCTEHLKLAPARRWIEDHRLDWPDGFERYIGIRRDESDRRKAAPETCWDDYFGCWLHSPIVHWSKAEVFQFLKDNGEKWNPLYDLGFGRVGCAPCVNSGKEDIRLWVLHEPAMIDKVRAWEAEVGRTFFPPMVPGKEINWVDEVVDWAKTTHGGKQYALPLMESDYHGGMCMHKHGFCE
jgi:3'-phosphoadenosine 5'-phosphosulfate sulfotransferase (PAPS reductase)/FAD synthetase